MYPNSEAVGIVLNQQEMVLAQFAYERALDTMKTADELKLPPPNEDGMFVLDDFSTRQMLSAAKIAKRISVDNLWVANSQFAQRRKHDAEPEELQAFYIEKMTEKDNIAQLGALCLNAEACFTESQSDFIDRKRTELPN